MMRIKVRKLALYLDRDHTSTSGQVVDVKYHILRVLLLLLVLIADWAPCHPVYFWPKLTSRLVEGSHQVAIFQIVMVVAIKRPQGDPGSAKSMQTDILTH